MEGSGSDVDTQEGEELGEYIMCLCFLFFLGSRDQRWAHGEQLSAWDNPRGDHGPHLQASGPAPSLQQSPDWQPLRSDSRPRDCRYSPYGCCPDGHTTSLGPQWQGCPGASCGQSRSVPLPPHQVKEGEVCVLGVGVPDGWGSISAQRGR